MTSNPIVLTVFLAPFAVSVALFVLRTVCPRTALCAVSLAAVLTAAAALLAVNFAGILLGNFDRALLVAWIAALASVPLSLVRFRRARCSKPLGRPDQRTRFALLVVFAPLVILVAMLAASTNFHDEIIVTGHQSVSASMARGVYPPVYFPFPETPYKYHYGFDTLAAVVIRLGGVGAEAAVDIVGVILFVALLALSWSTVHETTQSALAAWVAAMLVTVGGAFAILLALLPGFGGAPLDALAQTGVSYGTVAVNPNMLSYFFQHPFALGTPLFLACVYLYVRYLREERLALVALMAPLLGALALSQICLFAILCCALFVYPAVAAIARSARFTRIAVPTALCLLAGLALAWLAGGFFVSADALERPLHIRAQLGALPGGVFANLAWMLASNGLVLVFLAPAAVFAVRRRRDMGILCSIMALGALLVPHLFYYDRTWDIVKFMTVSYVAGALAVADLVASLRAPLGRRSSSIVVALLVVAVLPGVFYLLLNVTRVLRGDVQFKQLALERVDREALDWLRAEAAPDDVVATADVVARDVASYTGLFNPLPDNAHALGFPLERCLRREDDLFFVLSDLCFRRLGEMGADWLYLNSVRVEHSGARARANFDFFLRSEWITVRTFGVSGNQRLVCRLSFPSGDFPCLCNTHIDDYWRSQGATGTGEDLLAKAEPSLPSRWRPATGDLIVERSGVQFPADGRASPSSACLRVRNATVASIPAEMLLQGAWYQIHFRATAPHPHFGEVRARLRDGSATPVDLRRYRWVARAWEPFDFFIRLPEDARGDLDVILDVMDRGQPGEVFYVDVAVRSAAKPVVEYPN